MIYLCYSIDNNLLYKSALVTDNNWVMGHIINFIYLHGSVDMPKAWYQVRKLTLVYQSHFL